MEDTQLIALYYKEHDPMKRKMFLDQSIAAGEDTEGNAIRKELWDIRYSAVSETGDGRADGIFGTVDVSGIQQGCRQEILWHEKCKKRNR